MATKNYKPTSTGNGKFFWQHFEKVDTDEDGAIDASQFYTAIQNIMNDKSINGMLMTISDRFAQFVMPHIFLINHVSVGIGGFKDNQPPKWEDLEKNEDGKLDLQDFLMAVQQRWDPHK
jgi:hypothetical protein